MTGNYAGRSVLVADDEELVRTVLSRTISHQFGSEVTVCADGDEALRLLRDHSFDLFIADMRMPGCHGLELVRRAKNLRPDCDVLVATAYPEEFPYIEVVQAGAADFIIKPHSSDEICAKILRLFRERELRETVEREKRQILEDMEAIRRLQAARSLAEQKYALLFELSMDGMVVFRPQDRRATDVNRAFCELSGRSREELVEQPVSSFFLEADRERFETGLDLVGTQGKSSLADIRLPHPSGAEVWLDVNMTLIRDESDSLILLDCKDVTQQREIEERLIALANTDELTGLYNQRTFYTRLNGSITRAVQQRTPIALVFMDVDNFKQCNDLYGHLTGDSLLRSVGAIIRHQIRGGDEGFRYGGDEFAIILKNAGANAGKLASERIQQEFARGDRFGTSLSFGIAEYESGMTAHELVKAADEALYQAKLAGKNNISVAPSKVTG